MITLDFETEAVGKRPHYPPKPECVAYKSDGKSARYISWGHPGSSPDSPAEGKQVVRQAFAGKYSAWLFHIAKFGMEVAQNWLGIDTLPREGIHDTLSSGFSTIPVPVISASEI